MTHSKLIAIGGLLALLGAGGSAVWAQSSSTEQPQPELEELWREQLRKIDRWGVKQLLRTERNIDIQQKKRAITSTNPEELAHLGEDEDSGVRFHVAANPHTSLDILLRLASDSVPYVRSGVAMTLSFDPLGSGESQSIIEMIAQKLATDTVPLVRFSLVENQKLPPTVFDALAHDPDFIIRQRLDLNLYATQSALAILAQDSVQAVQVEALRHRNMPLVWLEKLSEDVSSQIRMAACQNINTPVAVLSRLSSDQDPMVRRAVADHVNTPLEILEKMARDNDMAVVVAVANHPKADRELLIQLAYDDRDPEIRLAAHKHLEPLLRSEIREDIMERWKTR